MLISQKSNREKLRKILLLIGEELKLNFVVIKKNHQKKWLSKFIIT